MKLTTLTIFSLLMLMSCNAENKNSSSETKTQAKENISIDFNADSAYKYIEEQVNFGPRVPGTESHRRCAEYLANTLRRHGADTVLVQKGEMPMPADGKLTPITNIMGRFNTSAPKRILIAAHYDTRPWADEDQDKSKSNTPIPGANDGGSGVGVILELARMIGEKSPAVGVDFLLVDAEDSGIISSYEDNSETWCIGTQYWILNQPYHSAIDRPVYGIVLDMVGGQDAIFYREIVSEQFASSINDKVWGVALKSDYSSRFNNSVRGSLVDDHLYINYGGIPCIDIVECNNPQTGSFPPTWHTMADNMDAIDRNTLKAVGQVVADVIYSEKIEN